MGASGRPLAVASCGPAGLDARRACPKVRRAFEDWAPIGNWAHNSRASQKRRRQSAAHRKFPLEARTERRSNTQKQAERGSSVRALKLFCTTARDCAGCGSALVRSCCCLRAPTTGARLSLARRPFAAHEYICCGRPLLPVDCLSLSLAVLATGRARSRAAEHINTTTRRTIIGWGPLGSVGAPTETQAGRPSALARPCGSLATANSPPPTDT